MELETYLNAMVKATQEYGKKSFDTKYLARKLRQVFAFRERILRMFSIGRSINADLNTEIEMLNARIAELEEWLEHSAELILHYEHPDG